MDASGQASRAVDRATMDWAEPQPAHGTGPLPQPAGGTRPDAHTLGCILDEIDYGVLLVDAAARPLYANGRARRECLAEGGLLIEHGRVWPRSPQHWLAFLHALQASLKGRRSLLAVQAAGMRLNLAIVPMGSAQPGAPAALLVTGKRQACEPLSVELFARAHRLTAAEGAVLGGLSSGLRPADIAKHAGVSMATIRTQISVIRAKTSTASICDLLHQIAALPPITSALDKAACALGGVARSGPGS